MKRLICAVLVAFELSACGPGQILGPTLTNTPTATSTATATATPTATATSTSTPTPTSTSTSTPTVTPTPTAIVLTDEQMQSGLIALNDLGSGYVVAEPPTLISMDYFNT